MSEIQIGTLLLLMLCLLAIVIFEFINGFHDTAVAVTTVIYSKAMKPIPAVILSGIFNFLGVLSSGLGVGLTVIYLLPLDFLVSQSQAEIFCLFGAILMTAIAWNYGTWYFGIPNSSSHTLFGSILGGGLAYAYYSDAYQSMDTIHVQTLIKIVMALLIAPLLGFVLAYCMLFLAKKFTPALQKEQLFTSDNLKPPSWIKWLLISTSALVSFNHGRNDGQKGMGLALLLLISILPLEFSLNQEIPRVELNNQLEQIEDILAKQESKHNLEELHHKIEETRNSEDVYLIRNGILFIDGKISTLLHQNAIFTKEERAKLASLLNDKTGIKRFTNYCPLWVQLMIALALGLGTMFSWKRIVVTIGEKIGKTHLNYAQGAVAELVAASTIAMATRFNLPVSTTHTLSSGVAGTMVAYKGVDNLRTNTISYIVLTWLLTLPITIGGAALILFLLRLIFI